MTKTCGECKHCTDKKVMATCKHVGITTGDVPGSNCKWFEQKKITNGDKIRQMSNEDLASIISTSCDKCGYRPNQCISDDEKTCYAGHLIWLNAPAESEVEDE